VDESSGCHGYGGPSYVVTAAISYSTATWVQSRRPKMLILRRFGDPDVEIFLGHLLAGIGTFARPVWLYDARARPSIRKHLPAPFLYVARTFVWLVFALAIIGRKPGNTPSECLWVAWMVIASAVYHRYKGGRSPTTWISCLGAAGLSLLQNSPLPFFAPAVTSSWEAAFGVALKFVMLWSALAAILALTPLKMLLSWLHEQRFLRTPSDLAQFAREMREVVLFPRYVPVAPIHVAEIVCAPATWAGAVYEAIGQSSMLVVDVSNIDDTAAVAWEIRQGRAAGAPIFLTCEERAAPAAVEVLARLGITRPDLFLWHRDTNAPGEVSFDRDRFLDALFAKVDAHLAAELSYLPTRPSREEAAAELHSL
jgi:hypothetical protein